MNLQKQLRNIKQQRILFIKSILFTHFFCSRLLKWLLNSLLLDRTLHSSFKANLTCSAGTWTSDLSDNHCAVKIVHKLTLLFVGPLLQININSWWSEVTYGWVRFNFQWKIPTLLAPCTHTQYVRRQSYLTVTLVFEGGDRNGNSPNHKQVW